MEEKKSNQFTITHLANGHLAEGAAHQFHSTFPIKAIQISNYDLYSI